MASTPFKLTAILLFGLSAAGCSDGAGGSSAFGAAPQTYEPLGPVTCQGAGDRGLGFSQDCRNRNGSGR